MIRFLRGTLLWLLLTGCDDGTREVPEARGGVEALPHMKTNGKSIPYLRYTAASSLSEPGKAFFLYPVMQQQTELIGLDLSAGTRRIEDLFGEELFGATGRVFNQDATIGIDFLPISLPIDVAPGQSWSLHYARKNYRCRSQAAAGPAVTSDRLVVSCSNARYKLGFVFDRDRGIEEYQDFCGNKICTYRLLDEEGLLSREMLDYIGLSRI